MNSHIYIFLNKPIDLGNHYSEKFLFEYENMRYYSIPKIKYDKEDGSEIFFETRFFEYTYDKSLIIAIVLASDKPILNSDFINDFLLVIMDELGISQEYWGLTGTEYCEPDEDDFFLGMPDFIKYYSKLVRLSNKDIWGVDVPLIPIFPR